MAPIKSSLARTVSKLFGVQKDTDLSLRGDVQSSRYCSSAIELQQVEQLTPMVDISIISYRQLILQSPQVTSQLLRSGTMKILNF